MQSKGASEGGSIGGARAPPCVTHATAYRVVKNEDVIAVETLPIRSSPPSQMFLVCDGHSGACAAQFVTKHFMRLLTPKLPKAVPEMLKGPEVDAFCEQLRKAICECFVRLDSEWSTKGDHVAGTTVTAVFVTGWILTVANAGDSDAIIDTGSAIVELTKSHRINTNGEEQDRLRAAGCTLASLGFHLQGPAKPGEQGVGPIRIWPGGLCVSRSIGDMDAGKEVVPVPHIRQLIVPKDGARILSASDGLWDVLSFGKAIKLIRPKSTQDAINTLIGTVARDLRMLDDTSVIVIDILPKGTTFPILALKGGSQRDGPATTPPVQKSKSGGLFACFKPSVNETPQDLDIEHGQREITFYRDIDCLKAYPGLKAILAKASMSRLSSALWEQKEPSSHGGPPAVAPNYTLHGGSLFANGRIPSAGRLTAKSSVLSATDLSPNRESGSDSGHGLPCQATLSSVLQHEVSDGQTGKAAHQIIIPIERHNSVTMMEDLLDNGPSNEKERHLYARLTASAHDGHSMGTSINSPIGLVTNITSLTEK